MYPTYKGSSFFQQFLFTLFDEGAAKITVPIVMHDSSIDAILDMKNIGR